MSTGTVDVSPLYQLANQAEVDIAGALIPLVVAYAVYLAHTLLLKIPVFGRMFATSGMETNLANGLNTALKNGMAIALAKEQAYETAHKDVEVQGAVQRMAVRYAIDHAPQAVKHFGLSPDELAEKALAFLPPPPSTTIDTTGVTVKAAAVTVAPLPPVT